VHDIGELDVPEAIFATPGPLATVEREAVYEHTEIGARWLASTQGLSSLVPYARWHHERFDGSGYPQKMKGEQIPFGARIFAVADTLDAMTSDRPYRAALPLQAARDVIERGSGTLFDPLVAAAFLQVPNETWAIIARETVAVQSSSVLAGGTIQILTGLPISPPDSSE